MSISGWLKDVSPTGWRFQLRDVEKFVETRGRFVMSISGWLKDIAPRGWRLELRDIEKFVETRVRFIIQFHGGEKCTLRIKKPSCKSFNPVNPDSDKWQEYFGKPVKPSQFRKSI